jgi:hypothetical protein
MTKKIIFLIAVLGSAVFLFIWLSRMIDYRPFFLTLTIFPILFLLSIISFFIREQVFKLWLKFVYVWVPLSMILVFIMPDYGSPFMRINKPNTSLAMSGLFLIISLVIIISKSIKLKKTGE